MKAVFQAILWCIVIGGCSRMTEDELWQKIERSRDSGNFDSTIQVCQTLIREYPDGQKEAAALYSIGETYQNGKHDYHAAVDYYKLFVRKHSDLNSTPVAMFVIGYIYNNNLQMIDSARVAYQEFLAKFPNHELASSAKFELENLGKSPDEIIHPNKEVAVKPSATKPKHKK